MRRNQPIPQALFLLLLVALILLKTQDGDAMHSAVITDSNFEEYVNGPAYIAKVLKVEALKVQVEVVKNLSSKHPVKPSQIQSLQLQGPPGDDEAILALRGSVSGYELVVGRSYIVLSHSYSWLIPSTPLNIYKVELMQKPDWQRTYLKQLTVPTAKSHLTDFSLRKLALPYLQKQNAIDEITIIEQSNRSDDEGYDSSLVELYLNQAKDKDQTLVALCRVASRLAKEPTLKAVVEGTGRGSMIARARCIELLAKLDPTKYGIDTLHHGFLGRFENDQIETDKLADFKNPLQFYQAFLIALGTYRDWERPIKKFAARLAIPERTRLANDLWVRAWEVFKQTTDLPNLYPILSLIFQHPSKRSIAVLALKPQQLKALDTAKWGVWNTLPQLAAVTGEVRAITQLSERYRKLFGKQDSDDYKSFATMMKPKFLALMKAYAPDRIYFRLEEQTAVTKLLPALRVLGNRKNDIVKSIRVLTPRPIVVHLSLKNNPSSGFFLDDAVAIAVTIGDADLLPKLILKEIRKDLKEAE